MAIINGTKGRDVLIGTSGDDTINGGAGSDTINGGAGNDMIDGGDGGDKINGGAGSDTMVGGANNDTFVENISENSGYHDSIDGEKGLDTLILQGTAAQLQLLSQAIAAFKAANHSLVFHFGDYAGGLLNLDVINVEKIQLVTLPNNAPTAMNDTYLTNEDTPLTILAAAGVLANDTDVDGDPLTDILVTGPAHGILTLNANGNFTYTPNANYNGADSFTYRASDGTSVSNIATVNITVNPVNDTPVAVNDVYSTNEDTPLTIFAAAGVLANDTDVDTSHTSLVVSSHTNPAHGNLTLNPDGSFTYTAYANYNGPDSFTYFVSDGSLNSPTAATVNITVNPVNDAPVAVNDVYSTNEDTPLTLAAAGVLANDTDVDGNPLTAILVTNPTHGTLGLNENGSFTYTPFANYNGPDSFTYNANDGSLNSPTPATVNITINPVNDAPVAINDANSVKEDTAPNPIAGNVLSNDTDVDVGDILQVTTVGTFNTGHGSLALNADGSYNYTLDNSNPAVNALNDGDTLVDSFVYSISDGHGGTASAQLNITINGTTDIVVNNAPVAVNDAYSTNEDTPLTIAVPGVLANDTDVDGNPLTAILVTNPTHGTLGLNENGSFTYTPFANYNGPDSFTYNANDGSLNSSTPATVDITINSVNDGPPVARVPTFSFVDTRLTSFDPSSPVFDGDHPAPTTFLPLFTDPDPGTVLTYILGGTIPAGVALNATSTGLLFTYGANHYITLSGLTIRAVDEFGAQSATTIALTGNVFDTSFFALHVEGTTVGDASLTATSGAGIQELLRGFGGNDTFIASAGDNTFAGGTGTADRVSYATAESGVTVDLSLVGFQNTGGSGSDQFVNVENLTGSGFNDTLSGYDGANTIDGGAGIDTISFATSTGAVNVNLGAFSSASDGSGAQDTLSNFENITGSSFDDYFIGSSGDNVINGGAGIDSINYYSSSSDITVNLDTGIATGNGNDTLSNIENIFGSQTSVNTLTGNSGNNDIRGGINDDSIDGGAGDDIITGNYGTNTLDGGAGMDTVSYAYYNDYYDPNSQAGVTVDLSITAQHPHGTGSGTSFTDTLSNFENIIGSNNVDTLTGNDGDNVITGGNLNDEMWGKGGNDTFAFYDVLYDGYDVIMDFDRVNDLLRFGSEFGGGSFKSYGIECSGCKLQ